MRKEKESGASEKSADRDSARENGRRGPSGPHFSTVLLLLLLSSAVFVAAFLYYDLFCRPVSALTMAADGADAGARAGNGSEASSAETAGTDGTQGGSDTGVQSAAGDGSQAKSSEGGKSEGPAELSGEEKETLRKMTAGLYGLTDVVITDGETAALALREVEDELGIQDAKAEYRFLSSSSSTTGGADIYRFQQYYNGIEVYGHTLKVAVDQTGALLYVNGHYAEISDLDTSYGISAKEAQNNAAAFAANCYGCAQGEVSADSAGKVIYMLNEQTPCAAYAVRMSHTGVESLTVIIDGQSGAVIGKHSDAVYAMATMQLTGQKNEKVTLEADHESDGIISLADTDRGIYIYDYYRSDDTPIVYDASVERGETSVQASGVDALYSLQKAYDFYKAVLGRNGIDNDSRDIYCIVDYDGPEEQDDGSIEYVYDNACYWGYSDEYDLVGVYRNSSESVSKSYYPNVLAHEFTHGVVRHESALGTLVSDGEQESQEYAINEALADIMAEMAEDYTADGVMNDDCDWDHEPSRDIKNATSIWNSVICKQITHVDDFVEGETDCHDASTILSFPAYLMNAGIPGNDLISTAQLSELYYETIRNMTATDNFWTFRFRLEREAARMNLAGTLNDDELETVIDAMDYSGIEPVIADYKVKKGGKLTILDVDGKKYDNYSIRIDKGIPPYKKTVVAEQNAESAVYQLPKDLAPGFYQVTLTDRSNASRTENFCILVNDNDWLSRFRIDSYEVSQDVQTDFNREEKEVVLVLDVSGSMAGDPISSTRDAVNEFVNTAVSEGLTGVSISLVTYSYDAAVRIQSSSDTKKLYKAVSGISADSSTNMYAGLEEAEKILNKSAAEKKIVILMSDGLPNEGVKSAGSYDTAVKELAKQIRAADVTIYALGFFSKLGGSDLNSAVALMKNLATDGYYYNISADGISGVFDDMASLVGGKLYYSITLACPVEAAVTSGGESLSSSEEYGSTRTSFGSVTFEGEEEDQTKILRLVTDRDYEICVYGTGKGTMDYTISFPDDEGAYTDVRTFQNIPITSRTRLVSTTVQSADTVLELDSDGDGAVDETYYASENSRGEARSKQLKKQRGLVLAGLALAAAAGILVMLLKAGKSICQGKRLRTKNRIGKAGDRFRPAVICKGVVMALCLMVIAGCVFTYRSRAARLYHELREHRLTAAQWVYDSGVEDSALSGLYLSVVLDSYLNRVQDGVTEGLVTERYAAEVYEIISGFDLGDVSDLAREALEDLESDGSA